MHADADAVAKVASLLANDPQGAQRESEALLRVSPRDPRLLLILASALRRRGDAAAALAILGPLAAAYPKAARTQHELGVVLLETGDATAGEAALRRATALNPDLAEAWRALGDHLFQAGDEAGAELAHAAEAHARLDDPELRRAAAAMADGRLMEAEDRLLDAVRRSPLATAPVRLLAETLLRQDRLNEAETLFAHCLAAEPDDDGVRFSFAMALFRRQAGAEALVQVDRLVVRDPLSAAYRNLRAACLALVGRHDEALAIYEALLGELPGHARIWLNYGHALRTIGRRDDAVAAYRTSIVAAPQLGEAYWALANLKTVTLQPGETADMAARLEDPGVTDEDRLHLHYALGKSAEDGQRHGEAFAHYAAGAGLRRARQPYSADAASAYAARLRDSFDAPLFARHAESGCRSDAPIFIVGLPRSGSTLVEQILASHSQVEGTMELPDIGVLAEGLRGRAVEGVARRYPDAARDLDPDQLRALGETYLARTRVHRSQGMPRFIDKMPNNFHHVGLIHLILPNARIIDVRRHPLGVGFAVFKQLFASGHPYSYDLAEIGRYYRDYVMTMRHFETVLPGRVHRLIYEDLVDDTETCVRALLDHCGLPFEDACLTFHRTERVVRTVSSEQVRQPIFRNGVTQWRNVAPWLAPLENGLADVLASWRT